jgi:hypothetical protein
MKDFNLAPCIYCFFDGEEYTASIEWQDESEETVVKAKSFIKMKCLITTEISKKLSELA